MQAEGPPDRPDPPARKRPGPRPRISREGVARAALEIGLEAVTLKALAAHLGVDHSSLYRHVRSRDEIIAAAADLAVSELDWRGPQGSDWRAMLERLADALWSLYERHPGLAAAFREMEVMPEAGITVFAEVVAALQRDGFDLTDAILSVDTLIDALTDCFTGWQRFTRAGPQGGQSLADRMTAKVEDAAIADASHAEQLGGMIGIMQGGPRDWWLKRQGLILAGIASLRRAPC